MSQVHLSQIHTETDKFFTLHWPTQEWGAPPQWTSPWRMTGTMEGGDKKGVYALLNKEDEVIYLGVGASLGDGRYQGHGINSRTGTYTRVAKGQSGISMQERRYEPSAAWMETGLENIA